MNPLWSHPKNPKDGGCGVQHLAKFGRLQIMTMAIEAEQKAQALACQFEVMTPGAREESTLAQAITQKAEEVFSRHFNGVGRL